MDTNRDGEISAMEWDYAFIDYYFNSGPDNTNSLFFGTLPEPNSMLENFFLRLKKAIQDI